MSPNRTAEYVPLDHAIRPPPRFRLVPFDAIKLDRTRNYLVKGLIPREGIIVVWGPPKCGKSFLVFDVMMHVALGWEYRGRRVTQGAIVYVACEGERGLGARAEAFRQARMAESPDEGVPFHLVTTQLDLVVEHHRLIADIQQHLGEQMPAAIVLDTLNRSLNGSESSDEDMAAYVRATEAVRSAFKCAVILIHHCGHEGTRPRGHSSLGAAVDTQIAVKRDAADLISATVELMKDGAEGAEIVSRLVVVDIGKDEDGDTIDSCVIEPADAPTKPMPGVKLSKNQETMLALLIDSQPEGMLTAQWYSAAKESGIGLSRPAELTDCRLKLKAKGLVHEYNGRWYTTR